MNFGQAFTYVFEDPDWIKKIGFVALCQLIPILGQFIALGFSIEIMKRVFNNDPRPLPEFNFGGFLGKGFQAFIISLVYSIPLIIFIIPISVVPALTTSMNNSDATSVLSIAVSCICGGLSILYGIAMAFVLIAAYGKYASTDSIGAAFKFGEIFGIVKKAFVPFLIALLGAALASLIMPLGSIACGIGILVTTVYYFAVTGHLYAQAYRQAVPY